MVLVVRYPGQSCVKGHHEQGELQEGPEQTGTSPSEAGLQVQLEGGDKREQTPSDSPFTCIMLPG